MAQSPSHRLGQIIGETLESTIRPILEAVAKRHRLYLDCKSPRKARGGKRKVVWIDGKGNTHELDYVIEAGGSDKTTGLPKAFIEIAWRRYTKHSRNKAQEIQGAIVPLAERYADARPFLGVILAGVFTEGSLNQLRSHGFQVIYFPYGSVVSAFAEVGIDAAFDEDTPDSHLKRKVGQYKKLVLAQRERIAAYLRDRHKAELDAFSAALHRTLTRSICTVYVLALHGGVRTLTTVADAIAFIEAFDEITPRGPFSRYEVGVRYSNGDEVRGQFNDKAAAIAFLRSVR
ncbi:MAG: DNA methylase [Planctomycetes bacterium]|nr:DNA methylase [Planctomycetota bacterium]